MDILPDAGIFAVMTTANENNPQSRAGQLYRANPVAEIRS